MSVLGAIVLVTALGTAPEPTPAPDPLTSSPNVQFRVLEPKPFPDALRHELTLQPFVPQIGSTFTTHWLTSFTYTFHATEWLRGGPAAFWVGAAAGARASPARAADPRAPGRRRSELGHAAMGRDRRPGVVAGARQVRRLRRDGALWVGALRRGR